MKKPHPDMSFSKYGKAKRKNLERSQRKNLNYGKTKVRTTSNISEPCKWEEWGEIFKVLRGKKPTNLEFHTLWNSLSKVKKKYRLSQIKKKKQKPKKTKQREFIASRQQ